MRGDSVIKAKRFKAVNAYSTLNTYDQAIVLICGIGY